MQTKLLYLEDFTSTESRGVVVETKTHEDGRRIVVLDQTLFYPQGGGQPYDQGIIEGKAGKFAVDEARFVEGTVKHIGTFQGGSFAMGDEVTCRVNKERRELNSRLHSAGHVVDVAVDVLKLGWTPGKGFHFPEGPYVEYAGDLAGADPEELKKKIEASCNDILREDRTTTVVFMDKDKMSTVCRFVPDYIPEGKPARVVMFGDFGMPCGGTHVTHLGEIGGITIRNVKAKGQGPIRVGYDVSRI